MQEPFMSFRVDDGLCPRGENLRTAGSGPGDQKNMNIKFCFSFVSKILFLLSKGSVSADQLTIHMNGYTASTIGNTIEVKEFTKQSPSFMAQMRGDIEPEKCPNQRWDLPSPGMHGITIHVDDTVSKANTLSYEFPDNYALFEIAESHPDPHWAGKTVALTHIFG